MAEASPARLAPAEPGHVALVTGASGGIGLAASLELARRGWTVWGGVRREAALGDLARAARDAGVEDRVHGVLLDVLDPDSFASALHALEAGGRTPDALVACAGYGVMGFVEELTDDTWRDVLEVNVLGTVRAVRAVLPSMRARRTGHLVLVSSNAANLPMPAFTPYVASKWALEGFGESLAVEVAPYGIGVTIVQPGSTDTRFSQNLVAPLDPIGPNQPTLERMGKALGRLGRWGGGADRAARSIADAAEGRTRQLRVRVGPDAIGAACIGRVLSGGGRVGFSRRFFGLTRPA